MHLPTRLTVYSGTVCRSVLLVCVRQFTCSHYKNGGTAVVFLVGDDLTLFSPTADRLGAPYIHPSAVHAGPIFSFQRQLLAAGRRERQGEKGREGRVSSIAGPSSVCGVATYLVALTKRMWNLDARESNCAAFSSLCSSSL